MDRGLWTIHMPHFFIPPENIINDKFVINGAEAHHLINVRRSKIGDEIRLFDGTGKSYLARIEQISKSEIAGSILDAKQAYISKLKLNIYQSVPKGDRFDWMVEKFAELGVSNLVPLITSRSVLHKISESKIKRWKRLSASASQQCLRPDIMNVADPVVFGKALDKIPHTSLSIIPWEGEETKSISEINLKNREEINILIGPEGGFTMQEIDTAKKAGLIPVTLGSRILRVETAGLLSAILILNAFGEFNKSQDISR